MFPIEEHTYGQLLAEAGGTRDRATTTAFLHALRDACNLKHIHFAAWGASYEDGYYYVSTVAPHLVEAYNRGGLYRHDPVRRITAEGFPVNWRQVEPQDEAEKTVLESRYSQIGRKGVSIPIRSSDSSRSVITLVGRDDDAQWDKRLAERYHEFKKLGMMLHVTFLSDKGVVPPAISLSKRHIDCLRMLASGMNEKQIASFLGLSEKCVKTYLSQSKDRLKARSKIHMVAAAFSLGMLHAA